MRIRASITSSTSVGMKIRDSVISSTLQNAMWFLQVHLVACFDFFSEQQLGILVSCTPHPPNSHTHTLTHKIQKVNWAFDLPFSLTEHWIYVFMPWFPQTGGYFCIHSRFTLGFKLCTVYCVQCIVYGEVNVWVLWQCKLREGQSEAQQERTAKIYSGLAVNWQICDWDSFRMNSFYITAIWASYEESKNQL